LSSTDSLADHLCDIDSECSRIADKLQRDFDGDISLVRCSENEIGPVSVDFNFGIRLEVEPGDSVRADLIWALECLAGSLGCRVVKGAK